MHPASLLSSSRTTEHIKIGLPKSAHDLGSPYFKPFSAAFAPAEGFFYSIRISRNIDPPYNTGNEGWVYNDNVNDPKIKKCLGEVVGKEGEDFTRHDKWLCMMYPRLKLLHKLLAEDGAIFISIDDTEYANLKLICDEIFGSNCFH